MKKILSMVLAVIMLAGCVLAFSACSLFAPKPELDLATAEKAFEKDDKYNVSYEKDAEDLAPYIVETLRAVKYDDDFDVQETLSITVYADSKTAKIQYNELKDSLAQSKKEIEDEIEWIEHLLDEYESKLESDEIDEYNDELKELNEELEEMDKYVIGRKGETVWYGTEGAIEDSKA